MSPDHNCAEATTTNQQRAIRLPTPRANIELGAPRHPSPGLIAQLDEASKAQVKLLSKVQDTIEPLANIVAYVTNETIRGVETARDDLAILLSVVKLCHDKEQIVEYLEHLIDPGIQPQDPIGPLRPKEEYDLPSLKELQYRCDTAALPDDTGPYSLRAQLAQLTALGDARVTIHKLTEEIFLRNRVRRPTADPDPAELAAQDRRTFLSAAFYKKLKALPAQAAKRPHGDTQSSPRGHPKARGRGNSSGARHQQGQRGRYSQGRGGGRHNQPHLQWQPSQQQHQQPYQQPSTQADTPSGQATHGQAQGAGQTSYPAQQGTLFSSHSRGRGGRSRGQGR